jgi:hypothetical protein
VHDGLQGLPSSHGHHDLIVPSERPVNRRVLIATDAVLAVLLWLIAVVNFVLDEPAGVVGGVSAAIVGTCAAFTTCVLIVSGGRHGAERRRERTREPR